MRFCLPYVLTRLYNSPPVPTTEYFAQNLSNRTASNRAPKPVEWQAAQEVVSVLDDAAQITKAIRGGRHAFVGKAINDLAVVLETSCPSTPRTFGVWTPTMAPARQRPCVADLLTEVKDLLKNLVQAFQKRGLGRALEDVEKICLLLDPRFKSLCTPPVCLNGGNDSRTKCALWWSACF